MESRTALGGKNVPEEKSSSSREVEKSKTQTLETAEGERKETLVNKTQEEALGANTTKDVPSDGKSLELEGNDREDSQQVFDERRFPEVRETTFVEAKEEGISFEKRTKLFEIETAEMIKQFQEQFEAEVQAKLQASMYTLLQSREKQWKKIEAEEMKMKRSSDVAGSSEVSEQRSLLEERTGKYGKEQEPVELPNVTFRKKKDQTLPRIGKKKDNTARKSILEFDTGVVNVGGDPDHDDDPYLRTGIF